MLEGFYCPDDETILVEDCSCFRICPQEGLPQQEHNYVGKGTQHMTKLINIGHGQFVNASKVIAVVAPQRGAKDKNILDVTLHRKKRSMIVMDTGLKVLSFHSVETLKERLNEN